MSMFALCDCMVSLIKIGSAYELICWSLPLPLGYCRTDTAVILLPSMVSSTCTGPHRVDAVDPVTVRVLVDPEDPELEDSESEDPELEDPEDLDVAGTS